MPTPTGSFQNHQCLEERDITFSQMKKFSILQGIAVTYCDDRPAAKRILVQFTAQNLQFTYVHKTSVLHFL